MKKIIQLIITTLICVNLNYAQSNLSEIEKIASTGKIWGFLKYYHPQVADGKYNWDEKLFDLIPKVRNSKNKEEFSQIFIDLIDDLGEVDKCISCGIKNEVHYFDKNFDLRWIENDIFFNMQLIDKLKNIEVNRHQGEKYYVSTEKNVGNIKITNENDYKNFDWRNEQLRLLTLLRYWNIVEYFSPYKYQTDLNWDEILLKMIPKFLNAKTEKDFHLAMLELVISLDDSHNYLTTNFTREYFGNKFIPSEVKIIDDKAVVNWFYSDSLAKVNDLKIGDVISKVNGKTISSLFKEKKKYVQGSNLNVKKAFFTQYSIFNGSTDSVTIEYNRENELYSKTIGRYQMKYFDFNWPEVDKFKILENNIGYINLEELKIDDVSAAMEHISNTGALIIDIRGYPNGTLYALSKYLSSKENEFFKVTYPDLNYPGKFIWRSGRKCGAKGELKYKGKVILLVNELTQSHAEFTTMCLQTSDNVTTIGSQTSGADGNVSKFKLVGGFYTQISGIGIFYPDRTETQRKGVKIDIKVNPTIKGIKLGKDEVLDRAIQLAIE